MSSPENSPIFTAGAVYTQAAPSDSLWEKITGGLGNVLGGLGNYAREALPYIAQAASAYGNAMSTSSPSTGTTSDTSNPLIYQPGNVNLPYVTPIPITPVSVNLPKPQAPTRLQTLQTITRQLRTGINPVRTARISLLNALDPGAVYPTHSQPSAPNAQVSPIQASQGSLLSPQTQNTENPAPHWIQEPPYSTQGAQQPVSYAPLYQDQPQSDYPSKFLLGNISPHKELVDFLPLQFPYPTKRHTDNQQSAQKTRKERLNDSALGQVELNLDHLKSRREITETQYRHSSTVAKILFADNWLQHDGRVNNDGTVTYRNIKVNQDLAPLLAYVDAEKYWKTDTHLQSNEDWQGRIMKLIQQLNSHNPKTANKGHTWLDVLHDWFFEKGAPNRVYDAHHPITRDLMKDEGVQQAREEWIKKGKPDVSDYHYPFRIKEYLRELMTLDGTGSLLGSYTVKIRRQPNKLIQYTVENMTGWQSGTHMPPAIRNIKLTKDKKNSTIEGMLFRHQPITAPESILENRQRTEFGPGGNLAQTYIWYETE